MAIGAACVAIRTAAVEASCYRHAVGLVRVMGRDAGFVAAHATLASSAVDICIVPEVPVTLESVLKDVHRMVTTVGTCVIVVAEGASKHFLGASDTTDASGNPTIPDVGDF